MLLACLCLLLEKAEQHRLHVESWIVIGMLNEWAQTFDRRVAYPTCLHCFTSLFHPLSDLSHSISLCPPSVSTRAFSEPGNHSPRCIRSVTPEPTFMFSIYISTKRISFAALTRMAKLLHCISLLPWIDVCVGDVAVVSWS